MTLTLELWNETAANAHEAPHRLSWGAAAALDGMDILDAREKRAMAGWLRRMPIAWLATLQYPDDQRKRKGFRAALVASCADGHLPSLRHPRAIFKDGQHFGKTALEEMLEMPASGRRLTELERAEAYRVDAVDAVGWFDDAKLEPSEHIAAWFAACGLSPTSTLNASPAPDFFGQLRSPATVIKLASNKIGGPLAKKSAKDVLTMSDVELKEALKFEHLQDVQLVKVLSKVILRIHKDFGGKAGWKQIAEWVQSNCHGLIVVDYEKPLLPCAAGDDEATTVLKYYPNGLSGNESDMATLPRKAFGNKVDEATRQAKNNGMSKSRRTRLTQAAQ